MENYIRGVKYIQEEKMKQEEEEKKTNDARVAHWKAREPALVSKHLHFLAYKCDKDNTSRRRKPRPQSGMRSRNSKM